MILDLFSLVDLVDNITHLVEFSLPLSGHLIAFLLIGLVLIYFAWRSTDIPDLPSPPRPPYVIQIHASINTTGNNNGVTGRQNLSDVRLLNSGPVIDSVLRSLPNRHHHQTQHHQHNHGRHGALFLGLLRRPQSRGLLPLPIPATIRSRFQSPQVFVYHQVNVYHHTHAPPPTSPRNANSGISTVSSSSINHQQQQQQQQQQHITTTTTTTTTSETLNVPRNIISGNNNVASSNSSRTPEGQQSNINVSNTSQSGPSELINSSLHSTRRSLSENNIADLEVESEQSTVDVVEVEVDDLNVSESTSQVGVDVNLNGGVTIVENLSSSSSTTASVQLLDGLNLNVNSNLVTMNSTNNHGINNTATSSSNSSLPPNDASIKDITTNQHHGPKTASSSSTSSPATITTSNDSMGNNTPNSVDGDVRVTLKFLNDTQMEVVTQLSETIVDFKRRHFSVELNQNKIVRLIFNGRVLDNDGRTLQESGIFDQCVVHCLIVTPQTSQQRATAAGHGQGSGQAGIGGDSSSSQIGRNLREGPEPGMFFVSLLGIILVFLWFVCYQFGHQLFTNGAVISLVVLTVIFLIFFLPRIL